MNLIIVGGLTIRSDLLQRRRNELFRRRSAVSVLHSAYCCMTVYFDIKFTEF